MRVLKLFPALLAALLLMAPPAVAAVPAGGGAVLDSGTQIARVGGFGRSRGTGGFRPRSRPIGSRRPGRGRGIFRSIIRALAIGYLLHLLLTTPGGNIVLLFMLAGTVMLVMRFRRRSVLRY